MFNKLLFRFTLITLIIFVLSLSIEGYTYSSHPANNNPYSNHSTPCTKCAPQPPDCTGNSTAPHDGGPPCSCTRQVNLPGCTLQPCTSTSGSPCDCSQSTNTTNYCHRYRCSSTDGGCETCEAAYPPDCVAGATSPKNGGAPCTCSPANFADGCTLAPCRHEGSSQQVCICQPGLSVLACYNARCPGSNKTTTTTTFTTNVATVSKLSSLHTSKLESAMDAHNTNVVHNSNVLPNSNILTSSNVLQNSHVLPNSNNLPHSNALTSSNVLPNSNAAHSSNAVNSVTSLLNLNLLSSVGHQNSGILNSILGG